MYCWEILGIEKTDNVKKIKKAYTKTIKRYHPKEEQVDFLQVRKAYRMALTIAAEKKPGNKYIVSKIMAKDAEHFKRRAERTKKKILVAIGKKVLLVIGVILMLGQALLFLFIGSAIVVWLISKTV